MGKTAEIINISRKPSTIQSTKPTKKSNEIHEPELVDELVATKAELDKFKKKYASLQAKAKDLARKEWINSIDSGQAPTNIRFIGNDGSATVSAKFRPKTAQRVNKELFVEQYGKDAFTALFSESVDLKLTSDPESFIEAAIDAGLELDEYFDLQTIPTPVEGCFANLASLPLSQQDLEGIEADLYGLHNSPTVTVTKKKG